MKKIPNWYVITGGPNSGKTTTVQYIKNLGYHTVPEYARLLVKKEMAKGKKLEVIRKDEVVFQNKVSRGQLQLENKSSKKQTIFFDRTIIDNIAYYHYLKTKVPSKLLKLAKHRYKQVFLLDMLPYHKDYVRNESKKDAKKIHKWIKKVYKELGYKIVRIPVMPIEDRVKFILKRVSSV